MSAELPEEITRKLDSQHNDVMELLSLLGRILDYIHQNNEKFPDAPHDPAFAKLLVDIETVLLLQTRA